MSSTSEFKEIFENALKDPTLLSTLDIEKLLETIDKERNDYLENKTTQGIIDDIFDKISELNLPSELSKKICDKLIGYRYVDEIHELHKGKHVRWIRTGQRDTTLTNGGIITDIKFLDNGTHVLCMNPSRRFIQYKFDDCLTFQKMSTEEQLILLAYEGVKQGET